MKTRILFSTNDKIGSRLIRFGTRSEYSHCDLISPSGLSIIGAVPFKGVVEYPLEERVDQSTKWAVYEIDADPALAWRYAQSQFGKSYDWLGVLGIVAMRDWEGDDKWFCSELVAKACLEAGRPILSPQVRINRITPQMLLHSPLLTEVDSSDRLAVDFGL